MISLKEFINRTNGKVVGFTDTTNLKGECFVKGTLVLMGDGSYKPIEKIDIGDKVYNYDGTKINTITNTMNREKETYLVRGYNSMPIITTKEHPFYTIKSPFTRGIKEHLKLAKKRRYFKEEWVEAGDLKKHDAVIIPTVKVDKIDLTDDELRFYGFFLAEGYSSSNKIVVVATNKVSNKLDYLKSLKVNLTKGGEYSNQKGMYRFNLTKKDHPVLSDIILNLSGGTSLYKQLPTIFTKEQYELIFEGYLKGDGSITGENQWVAATVSKPLAMGIQYGAFVSGWSCGLSVVKRSEKGYIEGRKIHQNTLYKISLSKGVKRASNKAINLQGKLWQEIRDVKPLNEKEIVYNLSTDGDNTYVVENIGVHNCVTLIQEYIRLCYGVPFKARGHAKAWINTTKDIATVVTKPQYGDIIVWDGTYGHVAIYIDGKKYYDQWVGKSAGYATNSVSSNRKILGYLRLKGNRKPDEVSIPTNSVYIVKKGDTLSKIASQYNTTYQTLAKHNNISNPNVISVGQEINIPSAKKYNLTRLLKIGCKGDDVKELQKALGGLIADGIFGAKTLTKVKAFQKSKKIYQDGIVGQNTAHTLGWTYLNK